MRTHLKLVLITMLIGLPAFSMGGIIWPPAPGIAVPTPGQVPYFILLSIFESASFGLGFAFLFFALPHIRRLAGLTAREAFLLYLSVGWLLISWWPHDNLHQHIGEDVQKLLYVEFGFHVSSMIVAAYVAYCLIKIAAATPKK